MNVMKKIVKGALDCLGYEISKNRRVSSKYFPADPFEALAKLTASPSSDITIFDVGAHKGNIAKKFRNIFPNARIYCFEPFPDSIAVLQKELSFDNRIEIVPKAVGRENGKAKFFVNKFDATSSLLPRPSTERRYYPKEAGLKEMIEVDVVDLNDFSRSRGISSIDILKLDIQGGELNALKGIQPLLNTGKISLIYLEIMFVPHYENAALFHEIWSFLAEFDYSIFDIYDLHRASNGQIRYGDALFVSKEIRKNVIDQFSDEP